MTTSELNRLWIVPNDESERSRRSCLSCLRFIAKDDESLNREVGKLEGYMCRRKRHEYGVVHHEAGSEGFPRCVVLWYARYCSTHGRCPLWLIAIFGTLHSARKRVRGALQRLVKAVSRRQNYKVRYFRSDYGESRVYFS
jgi:hypothetical protein